MLPVTAVLGVPEQVPLAAKVMFGLVFATYSSLPILVLLAAWIANSRATLGALATLLERLSAARAHRVMGVSLFWFQVATGVMSALSFK